MAFSVDFGSHSRDEYNCSEPGEVLLFRGSKGDELIIKDHRLCEINIRGRTWDQVRKIGFEETIKLFAEEGYTHIKEEIFQEIIRQRDEREKKITN